MVEPVHVKVGEPVNVIAFTKEQVVGLVNVVAGNGAPGVAPELQKKLATRVERQNLLERLGVKPDTPSTYRLVIYQDGLQAVALTGSYDEKARTITADKRLIAEDKPDEGRFLQRLFSGRVDGKPLPKSVIVPAGAAAERHETDGTHFYEMQIAPKDAEKLRGDITLLVLADKAQKTQVALSDSNASLPHRRGDRSPALPA